MSAADNKAPLLTTLHPHKLQVVAGSATVKVHVGGGVNNLPHHIIVDDAPVTRKMALTIPSPVLLHYTSHVTRHTSHVTRHTSHVAQHTLPCTQHASLVTRHTSLVTRHTSLITRHTSHVTRHTSHVTRHNITHHTSHARHKPMSLTNCMKPSSTK